MATRDLRTFSSPVGPLRDKYTLAVGTDDIVIPTGFICQAGSVGDITYMTLFGATPQTETVAEGDIIGLGNHPVLLGTVFGSSTITSIVVGTL